MVVFSDGEDLDSAYREADVLKAVEVPFLDAVYGIANLKVTIVNNDPVLAVKAGEEVPGEEIIIPPKTDNLGGLAEGGDIIETMEVEDRKDQNIVLNAPPVKVKHFRTTGSLSVEPASVRIEEIKTIYSSPMLGYVYFSGGSSDIPHRYVRLAGEIVGHTDTIGEEDYNIKLSDRQARAVHKLLSSVDAETPDGQIRHKGIWPREPLYDNLSLEARAFNRTVTITLEYMKKD